MKPFLPLIVIILLLGGAWYWFSSPPAAYKHKTEAALTDFSAAVTTKDRVKIGMALQKLLADKAQIHLDVAFSALGQANTQPIGQDFTKQSFIAFVDNILYSLSDYSYHGRLRDLIVSDDRKTATISLASQETGDGMSYEGGLGVNMHFSSDTTCDGQVTFEGKSPQLAKLTCKMQLQAKPSQAKETH